MSICSLTSDGMPIFMKGNAAALPRQPGPRQPHGERCQEVSDKHVAGGDAASHDIPRSPVKCPGGLGPGSAWVTVRSGRPRRALSRPAVTAELSMHVSDSWHILEILRGNGDGLVLH
jgi:hypothetical protein